MSTGVKRNQLAAIEGSFLQASILNGSGGTINKATPVLINGAGKLDNIDVSLATALGTIGVSSDTALNGNNNKIVFAGIIEDIGSSFANGDVIYVSKTGGLTEVKPSIGVNGFLAGDFVIIVGSIAENKDNPVNNDLLVNINLIGQL